MFCVFLLCASLYLSLPRTCVCQAEVYPAPIDTIIQDYFKTEGVRKLRKKWDTIKKPIEQALISAMYESVGLPGMNVYIRKRKEKLAAGFFHNDNQVRVVLKDLNLEAMPVCIFPDVKFLLASNILKIQTGLSKMIIHADYALIRNKTDVIHNPNYQDPFKFSPFLFEQVHDVGKVAITLESCNLKGFIVTLMNGNSINLGHDRFNIRNCMYTIEIYRAGDYSPPVIARYNMSGNGHGLSLTDLLKKPLLTDELLPKLQSALFSLVNTSAIFGSALDEYRENQEIVFLLTATHIAEVVRQMNKLTVVKNNGVIKMADYVVHWDDGRIKNSSIVNKRTKLTGVGESLKLTELVLTGLDTLYSAHAGGPFEFDTARIVEKLRFSSLQVRGNLEIKSTWSDVFDFAAEISDMTLELHWQLPFSENFTKLKATGVNDRQLEVEGLRRMTFTVPSIIVGSGESMIAGYLLKEVPKLVNAHSIDIFDQVMQQISKIKTHRVATPGPEVEVPIASFEEEGDSDILQPLSGPSGKDSKSEHSEYVDYFQTIVSSNSYDAGSLDIIDFQKHPAKVLPKKRPRRRGRRLTSSKRMAMKTAMK